MILRQLPSLTWPRCNSSFAGAIPWFWCLGMGVLPAPEIRTTELSERKSRDNNNVSKCQHVSKSRTCIYVLYMHTESASTQICGSREFLGFCRGCTVNQQRGYVGGTSSQGWHEERMVWMPPFPHLIFGACPPTSFRHCSVDMRKKMRGCTQTQLNPTISSDILWLFSKGVVGSCKCH
jgi:hypothetical protein